MPHSLSRVGLASNSGAQQMVWEHSEWFGNTANGWETLSDIQRSK